MSKVAQNEVKSRWLQEMFTVLSFRSGLLAGVVHPHLHPHSSLGQEEKPWSSLTLCLLLAFGATLPRPVALVRAAWSLGFVGQRGL